MKAKGLDWRNLLYAFLGFLCPLIWNEIIAKDPGFPLTSDLFTKFIIHLIGYLVGGGGFIIGAWNTGKLVYQRVIFLKYGVRLKQWLSQG